MTVWFLTQEQKDKYKKTYESYINKNFNKLFISEVISDFNALKKLIDYNISKCNSTDINEVIECVYNNLKRYSKISHCQSLNEVKNFGMWDINYGCITGTICIRENKIELSEFINAYVDNEFEPYEDLHADILQEVLDNLN